jgi:hypothetical protein
MGFPSVGLGGVALGPREHLMELTQHYIDEIQLRARGFTISSSKSTTDIPVDQAS